MNKKIIFFLLVLVSICAISHVSASDNLTDTQIISDDGDLEESQLMSNEDNNLKTDYRDIQSDINNAEEGDTLNLSGEYVCDYLINVNKSITINGVNDTTIRYNGSGDYQTPFFCVNASGVVLSNIKFIGGTFLFGGAITWLGDNGTVKNCTFTDNMARGKNAIGGALLWMGDNCTITNCTFSSNYADLHGGAILFNATGGKISDCVFSDNEAGGDVGYGGAIVFWGNNYTVENCNFTNNHCTDYGGAVASLNENNAIINSTFSGNYISNDFNDSVNQSGGAIFSVANGFVVDGCNFTYNLASKAWGGAISLYPEDIIRNSYFKGNKALYGNDLVYYSLNVISNCFVLDYGESEEDAYPGITVFGLIGNNTFIKTKINSSVSFSAGMVFEYTRSGSIHVSVEGGTINIGNITVLNHSEAKISYVNNVLTVSNLAVGKYTLRVITTPDENHTSVSSDLSITVNKATAVIKASKITVALKKGTAWTITIVDSKTGKGIANMKLTLKIYTGSKFKTVSVSTNSKGVASYKTSSLKKGSHKVVVSASHAGYTFNTLTSSIKVVKQTKLKFRVSKQTYKDSSTVMFRVFNKKTKKAINGVKFYLKIYTGKKVVKTITLKTKTFSKKKGIVGYNTNELSVGKHKVVLVPANVKYSGSKKSSMKITKKQKKYSPYSAKISAK